jgi:uncharacterized protein
VQTAPPPPEAPHDAAQDRPAGGPRMSRRAFLRLAGLGAAGLVVGGGAAGSVAEAYRFDVEQIAATVPSLRTPLQLAWLVDLHYGPLIGVGSVRAWVDAALAQEPDLIVLGGDMVDFRAPRDVSPLLAELERLRAPLGVFAIWGNHEYSSVLDLERLEVDFAAIGVPVLVNEGRMVRDDVYLAGVDTARVGAAAIRSALAGLPDGAACVVASHKPSPIPRMPEEVDLTLCGHTHGGQVRLPGIGPVLVDEPDSRRFDAGWFRAPGLAYVSRGLGVARLPIRFNCPAELTMVTLRPGEARGIG